MFDLADIHYVHPASGAVRPVTIELLRSVYLVPRQRAEFDLQSLIEGIDADTPWRDSYRVAPRETVAAIERALRALMTSTATLRRNSVDLSGLAAETRAHRHLSALLLLWEQMGDALPDDLWVLRHVIEAPPGSAIEPLPILDMTAATLAPACRSVLHGLVAQHGHAPEDLRKRLAGEAEIRRHRAPEHTLLGHVQRHMLSAAPDRRAMDDTISAYGVRDSAMEADIAASTIQRMLDRDPAMAPADCGLLIPDGLEYAIHVSDAFGRAGLPLSGLPAIGDRKDLAAELLTHFLLARRPSGPAMALASLLSSPLMPWSMEIGQRLANAVMSGNFRPDVGLLDGAGKSLYWMIRQDTVPTPASLAEDLLVIQRTGSEESGLQQDQARLRDLIARMRALLKAQRPDTEVQWDVLLRLVAPTAATPSAASLRTTLGVSIFSASRAPWRDVRHLFVLGYADGNYPGTAGANPFFLDSELDLIRDRCGLALPTQSQALADRMDTFQAQIGVASDSLTLLSPYRDCASGARLSPAASLPLLGRCIDVDEAEDIIIDLNGVADDHWPMHIPRALETKSMAAPLKLLVPEKIRLHRDLFAIRSKDDGSARRQSPSRLETLIVSPLAWLLSELDATDGVWEPETVDVKLKGSLAHEVLEHLFLPQKPVPSAADIHQQVPALLTDRMRHIAPFMLTSRWGLERRTLERDVLKAATNWREALIAQGAQVINNEFWLRGRVFGVEIHGKVDCLLRLPDGELVIVDHKKSGTRNRQERLEAGWDLQVELYRQMARTPAEDGVADETQRMLSASNSIGVAYHLMNDGGILLSSEAKGPNAPSVKRMANDISIEAMAKLAREVEALRSGDVAMNTDEDRQFFSKTARMGLYAFDASPLISSFSLRTAQEDEEIDDE